MNTRWPFEPLVRELIASLACGDYTEVERRTAGVQLSAKEIKTAVSEYGRRLTAAADGAALPLDVVELEDAEPSAWSVCTPLWTQEEGRSGLTLQLTIWARPEGGFQAEIDNILVP